MAFNGAGSTHRRSNPFARAPSGSPAASQAIRPKSAIFSSPSQIPGLSTPPPHNRTYSNGSVSASQGLPGAVSRQHRSDSKSGTPTSTTFAPSFIKTEEMRRSSDTVKGIEGENDFSGKRYVWVKDPQAAFVRGWIVEELEGNQLLVQCDDGTVSTSWLAASCIC
jgi:myosin protein heavy chain